MDEKSTCCGSLGSEKTYTSIKNSRNRWRWGWALLAIISLQIVRLEEVSNRVKKPVVAGDSEWASCLRRRMMWIHQLFHADTGE